MISVDIPERDYYDESTNTFVMIPARTINLEHSLVAISNWESKWMKPFLNDKPKTTEETYDYIQCMVVGEPCDLLTIQSITSFDLDRITAYIQSPRTATTITQRGPAKPNREVKTSELIYYWMIAFNIPFECQYWHLNRLLTLVNICNIKNDTSNKKVNPKDTLRRNAELNAARKKALNTSG